jgi:hypothetical protein
MVHGLRAIAAPTARTERNLHKLKEELGTTHQEPAMRSFGEICWVERGFLPCLGGLALAIG